MRAASIVGVPATQTYGSWPRGPTSVPLGSAVSVTGNDIYFDVLVVDPLTMCLPFCCPAWQQTESVGPLSPGIYTVHTRRAYEMFPPLPPTPLEPYTPIMEFIVSGNPDINEDGDVDLVDLANLARAWKAQPGDDNWNSSCNISEPNDDIIDEKDLAVIANNWLEGVPGIIYQIDNCTFEVASMSSPSPEYDELRFSVTVHGRNILFEDNMVANCCASELILEMTVEYDLITINEIEHTITPCLCICDYPVTAILGPFGPGTYVLEVYEDYGGFIGGTVVNIE